MAGIPSSPAVVFLEKDNSAYPPNVDSSIVGIVGYATKGPTNTPVLVTSQENLLRIFGEPNETLEGQGLIGALEILEATNQIRFVRVEGSGAMDASANILLGACPSVAVSSMGIGVTISATVTVVVEDNDGDEMLNKSFIIPSGTATTQHEAFKDILSDGSYITDKVYFIYNTDSPTTEAFIATPYSGKNASLQVTIQSANIDYTLSTPTGSAAQGLVCPVNMRGEFGFFNATGTASMSAAYQNYSSVAGSSVTAYGGTVLASKFKYWVRSLYPGTGYNARLNTQNGQTLGLSFEVDETAGVNNLVTVNNDGVAAETYKVSLLNGDTFVEDVINPSETENVISDYIKAGLYKGSTAADTDNPLSAPYKKLSDAFALSVADLEVSSNTSLITSAAPRFVKLLPGTYDLAGGSDGTGSNALTIGNAAEKTGMKALDDDTLNISIALVPGITAQQVQNELITMAESTQNFIAVVAPPMAIGNVEDALNWMNGRGDGRTAAINSSWGAVYWPWVQVFDVFSAKDRWYDPAIFAVRQMVRTDSIADPWFAAAGFRRGRLTKPTATEYQLNQGDRDALYTTNLNPVVNFVPDGITIFGQKTAQRLATALDRVNVRRLMIYLRKLLLITGRQDLFEPNDVFTWDAVKSKAESILSDIQARRGITDFRVVCDETTNTPLRVDRNELWCKILLKPTKTAEWIVFEVNLTSQSAKFG